MIGSGTVGATPDSTVRLVRAVRPYRARLRAWSVLLDGERVAKIRHGETIELSVSPGQHSLRLKEDWVGSPVVSFDVHPGQVSVFECRPSTSAAPTLTQIIGLLKRPSNWIDLRAV